MKKSKILLGLTALPLIAPTAILSSCNNNQESIGFYNIPREIYWLAGAEGQSDQFTIVKRKGFAIEDITDQITNVEIESSISSHIHYDLSKRCLVWDASTPQGQHIVKLKTQYENFSTEFMSVLNIVGYELFIDFDADPWYEGDKGKRYIDVEAWFPGEDIIDVTTQATLTFEPVSPDFPKDKIALKSNVDSKWIEYSDGIAPGVYAADLTAEWQGASKTQRIHFAVEEQKNKYRVDFPTKIKINSGTGSKQIKVHELQDHVWKDVSNDITIDFSRSPQPSKYSFDSETHSIFWKELTGEINSMVITVKHGEHKFNQTTIFESSPFEFELNEKGVSITNMKYSSPSVVVPDTILYDNQPKNVTQIYSVGDNLYNATSITFPKTLEYMSESILHSSSLQTITFPSDSVIQELPNMMCKDCRSLTEFIMPNSVVKVGGGVLDSCYELSKIVLSKNLKSIGNYAFKASIITEMEIPDGVTSMSDHDFENCAKLAKVNFPTGVTKMPTYTFMGCVSLKEIDYHSTLNAFKNVVSGVSRGWCDNVPRDCLIKCTDNSITLKELLGE